MEHGVINEDAIIVYCEHRCPEDIPCPKCDPKKFQRFRDKEIRKELGLSRIGRNNV